MASWIQQELFFYCSSFHFVPTLLSSMLIINALFRASKVDVVSFACTCVWWCGTKDTDAQLEERLRAGCVCLWAGSVSGVQERGVGCRGDVLGGGVERRPAGWQAGCLAVRWSELVCYQTSAAQSGNRDSHQADAMLACLNSLPEEGTGEVAQLSLAQHKNVSSVCHSAL